MALFPCYMPTNWDVGPVGRLEYGDGQWIIQVLPLEEQVEDRRLAQLQYEQERAKQRAEHEAAELRAATLLLTYLSPEQAMQYRKKGYFDLIGSLGGEYRIIPSRTYNVLRWRGGVEVAALCGGPRERLPLSDVLLAQYLALTADEADFLSTANAARPDRDGYSCGCLMCRNYYGTP